MEFIGEQDGANERLFKNRLTDFFQRDQSVQKAYLAKIEINRQAGVALCLKTQFGPDRGLAEKIGAIFKTIFNAHTHLDILFLNPDQEVKLARVCKPFFE